MLVPRSPDLARRVFSPIATGYDRPAVLLSLLQYRRWHRFLLARLDAAATEGHGARVLDMATGTGMLAFGLLQQPGTQVVGADITRAMLLQAQAKLPQDGRRLNLVECSAESPPFRDAAFDAVVFAYLLRYVDDVAETLRRMGLLVKRRGRHGVTGFRRTPQHRLPGVAALHRLSLAARCLDVLPFVAAGCLVSGPEH